MSVGTILLIAVAVFIMVIMHRVAHGSHGAADVARVAGRGADTVGEPPVVGAEPDDGGGGAPSDHGAHGGRHGCCSSSERPRGRS
jgi:hypothetical protein